MLAGTSTQNLVPDLNTGYLVDDGSGQFVGGPGDVGTGAADLVTSIQRWFWPAVAVVAALLILKR